MPVLTNATTTARPWNRFSASTTPSGMPSNNAIPVAVAEILSDNQVIAQTSLSKPATNSKALSNPWPSNSKLNSELVFLLARDGNKQRLAELIDAEPLNDFLNSRRYHEICEGLAAGNIDARTVGGIHFENRIDIQ